MLRVPRPPRSRLLRPRGATGALRPRRGARADPPQLLLPHPVLPMRPLRRRHRTMPAALPSQTRCSPLTSRRRRRPLPLLLSQHSTLAMRQLRRRRRSLRSARPARAASAWMRRAVRRCGRASTWRCALRLRAWRCLARRRAARCAARRCRTPCSSSSELDGSSGVCEQRIPASLLARSLAIRRRSRASREPHHSAPRRLRAHAVATHV